MDKPDILTTTQKNAQVQVLADEELVESHDGRKVTLVKHIYKHFDLDTQRGSPSAIIAAMNDLPLRSTCLSNWPDKANKLAVVIREHCTRVVVGLVGYGRYVVDPAITKIYRRR
jgi:catechol O-methyltransferase